MTSTMIWISSFVTRNQADKTMIVIRITKARRWHSGQVDGSLKSLFTIGPLSGR